MTDWRDAAVLELIQTCKGEGATILRDEDVIHVLSVLARRDKGRLEKERKGFFAVSEYAESGMTRFLNMVRANWNKEIQIAMTALQTPPADSVHRLECVLSVKLDKDTYDPNDLFPIFKDHLIQYTAAPFDCLVVQVARVFGSWYDVKLHYSSNLIDAYKLLQDIPWVKDVIARPVSDFGKKTLAFPE